MSLGELLAGLNRFFKTGKGLYGNGTHFEMSSLLAWLSAGCQTASVAAFMRLAASEVTVKPKSFRHSSFLLIGKWWKLLKAVRHLTNCQINLCSLLWKMCQSFLSFLDVGFFIDFFFLPLQIFHSSDVFEVSWRNREALCWLCGYCHFIHSLHNTMTATTFVAWL